MLPFAENAVVEPSKVRDCLLSANHPVGRFKAAVFFALGYVPERWQVLQADLVAMAVAGEAATGQASTYGEKFEVSGSLRGPSGREANFVSVWLLRTGEDVPRFITAYPG